MSTKTTTNQQKIEFVILKEFEDAFMDLNNKLPVLLYGSESWSTTKSDEQLSAKGSVPSLELSVNMVNIDLDIISSFMTNLYNQTL